MKVHTLSKGEDIDPTDETIKFMRESPYNHPDTTWYAYQNHDLGHYDLGRTAFLAAGPNNTLKTPPERYPDSQAVGMGWRYLLVGYVDLDKRVIINSLPETKEVIS